MGHNLQFDDPRREQLQKIQHGVNGILRRLHRWPVGTWLFRLLVLAALGCNLAALAHFYVTSTSYVDEALEISRRSEVWQGEIDREVQGVVQFVVGQHAAQQRQLERLASQLTESAARERALLAELKSLAAAGESRDSELLAFARQIDVTSQKSLTAVEKIDPVKLSIEISQLGLAVAGIHERLSASDQQLARIERLAGRESTIVQCRCPMMPSPPAVGEMPGGCACDNSQGSCCTIGSASCDCLSSRPVVPKPPAFESGPQPAPLLECPAVKVQPASCRLRFRSFLRRLVGG